MRVRPAVPADRPALQRILATAGNFTPAEVDVGLELLDIFWQSPPKGGLDGDYPSFVAQDDDGAVLGYVSVGQTPFTATTWHLYYIASDVQRRRSGVGRILVAAAREFVAGKGGKRLVLETAGKAEYETTRAFYQGTGWVEEARIADYYADGDAVVYFVLRF
jgi:ribosomal protein S18 acetylase RimI-like enzyme